MTNEIFRGRFTATPPSSYVAFLIGMRINRIFAVRKWMQVSAAIPRMLREVYAHPGFGFLGAESLSNWRGVTVLQYWKSFDHLHAYASNRDAERLPAWVVARNLPDRTAPQREHLREYAAMGFIARLRKIAGDWSQRPGPSAHREPRQVHVITKMLSS